MIHSYSNYHQCFLGWSWKVYDLYQIGENFSWFMTTVRNENKRGARLFGMSSAYVFIQRTSHRCDYLCSDRTPDENFSKQRHRPAGAQRHCAKQPTGLAPAAQSTITDVQRTFFNQTVPLQISLQRFLPSLKQEQYWTKASKLELSNIHFTNMFKLLDFSNKLLKVKFNFSKLWLHNH